MCVWVNWKEQMGSEKDHKTQGSSAGTASLKTSDYKNCGGYSSGRNFQPHRRVHWRDPKGLRKYTKPPTQESAPEGLNLFVGSGGSD